MQKLKQDSQAGESDRELRSTEVRSKKCVIHNRFWSVTEDNNFQVTSLENGPLEFLISFYCEVQMVLTK